MFAIRLLAVICAVVAIGGIAPNGLPLNDLEKAFDTVSSGTYALVAFALGCGGIAMLGRSRA